MEGVHVVRQKLSACAIIFGYKSDASISADDSALNTVGSPRYCFKKLGHNVSIRANSYRFGILVFGGFTSAYQQEK